MALAVATLRESARLDHRRQVAPLLPRFPGERAGAPAEGVRCELGDDHGALELGIRVDKCGSDKAQGWPTCLHYLAGQRGDNPAGLIIAHFTKKMPGTMTHAGQTPD
jgi:hypothetical protein